MTNAEAIQEPYLEVTFRRGKPLAAYFYLPRGIGQKSHHCRKVEPGLVIDLDREDQAIGIEITEPSRVTLRGINRVLRDLGQPTLSSEDLSPLRAA